MHTVLDFETLLPGFVCITNGKGADNTIAKKLHFARGTIVVADRIYSDTELLNHWDSTGVIFIVRGRDNIQFESIRERDLPDTTSQEILIDEEVRLTGVETASKYPKKIRRIGIYNAQGGYTIDLYTNDFKHAASTIAALYRSRWKIEIFFRNLKQNLHQELSGNLSKRCRDSDLDGSDYDSPTSISQANSKTSLVSLQFNSLFETQHVHQNRPLSVDQ